MSARAIAAILTVAGLTATSAPAQNIDGGVLVPSGFVRVWDDDRLNPKRGVRTAAGDAQMGLIWTNDVPQQLVRAPLVPVSTSAANSAAVSGEVYQVASGVFVQVSTFPDSTSAALTAVSLREAGIRTRRGVVRRGTSETPVVLAGPYATVSEATQAQGRLQQLGYSGAFVRN
jgi:hypothetical protein